MRSFDIDHCYICNKSFALYEFFIMRIHTDSEGNMGSFVCVDCLQRDSSENPILLELEKSFHEYR